MKAYQVIGGPFRDHWYGESDRLQGAKGIATRRRDHWKKMGWERPDVYLAEDVQIIDADGDPIRVPKDDAIPVDW